MRLRDSRGFTLTEMLIGLVVTSLLATGLATLMIRNAQGNKKQQMYAEAQFNARASMELVVTRLRSAGWDPMNAGIQSVTPDPTPGDTVSELEIIADLDEDGLTTSPDERVLIRHVGDRIEWRRDGVGTSFTVVATQITNDADGDGVVEPMFVLDDPTDPEVVTVQITARSSARDSGTGDFIRYTLRNQVMLRNRS